MKKLISLVLALAIVLSCIPVSALAAADSICTVFSPNASLLEVVKDGAPIRSGPAEAHEILTRCEDGVVLEELKSQRNLYGNLWYTVSYSDGNSCRKGYIYSKNVKKHSCEYEKMTCDGVVYKWCDCGRIAVEVTGTATLKQANALAVAGTAGAAGAAVLDGPLPMGDIIGLGILVTVGLLEQTGVLPSTAQVVEITEDISLEEYLEEKEDGVCPVDSYRRVVRAGNGLMFADNKCLNLVEAYLVVHAFNEDVWCQNYDTALTLALMHKLGGFSEIHNPDKDFYNHFHFGQNIITEDNPKGKHIGVEGGHIFYGTSALSGSIPLDQ